MKIFLDSVGCRLNQAEIEEMAANFRAAGHQIVGVAEEADMAVINTCTVTSQAASDSRQKARQAERSGVSEIILTGCWSTMEPGNAAALKKVTHLVPNNRKELLVKEILGNPVRKFDLEPLARLPLPGSHMRTRAFLKVQDGCDNRCTFCITTIARGQGRSREISEVINDVQVIIRGGAKEVVLTGVHLGAWGQDKDKKEHLEDLIRAILSDTDIPRIRLSSLEPWDLDSSFFDLWKDERMCRHLHLPLQSGSAGILKRMARKVTPSSYSALVKIARQTIPDVGITTDLITGFPGETEEEFNESRDFVEQLEFSRGHVFSYSSRPGTAAASMPDQVPFHLRKARNAILRTLLSQTKQEFEKRYLDQELNVLWETSIQQPDGSWRLGGHTDNYLQISAECNQSRWNQIDRVKPIKWTPSGLVGEIVDLK